MKEERLGSGVGAKFLTILSILQSTNFCVATYFHFISIRNILVEEKIPSNNFNFFPCTGISKLYFSPNFKRG